MEHVDIRNHLAHCEKYTDAKGFTFTSQIFYSHGLNSIYTYLYPQTMTGKIGAQWAEKVRLNFKYS